MRRRFHDVPQAMQVSYELSSEAMSLFEQTGQRTRWFRARVIDLR